MPVGPYATFDACVAAKRKKYGTEAAKKICGKMQAQSHKKRGKKKSHASKY